MAKPVPKPVRALLQGVYARDAKGSCTSTSSSTQATGASRDGPCATQLGGILSVLERVPSRWSAVE